MNLSSTRTLADPTLEAPHRLQGLIPHPIGVAFGFWSIVVIFLACLGAMMLVGRFRDRRKQR